MIGSALASLSCGNSDEASRSVGCSSLISKFRGLVAKLPAKPNTEVVRTLQKKDCEGSIAVDSVNWLGS